MARAAAAAAAVLVLPRAARCGGTCTLHASTGVTNGGDLGRFTVEASAEKCMEECAGLRECCLGEWVAGNQRCYLKSTGSLHGSNSGVSAFNCTCGDSQPTPAPTPSPPPKYPFQDPSLPVAQRARDLVSRLTLDEKGAQLGHYDTAAPTVALGRANSPAVTRLGVEPYNYGIECNTGILVDYPQNIGMAATFNRTLLFHAGRGTGLGVRAKWFDSCIARGTCRTQPPYGRFDLEAFPALSCWSPMINIMRHPTWGRNHEGYGEDPYLSGEMAYQVVKGMQGDDPKYLLMNAGPKHFAAFDGPGNGGNAEISDADWLTTYMPPFKRAFEAGAASTMCTYAELNGVHGCENPKLLTTWLRDEVRFDGYVVSDQGAIHDPAAAVAAGCDVEDGWGQYRQLPNLTKGGSVREADMDTALRRLFSVRIRHGEFDPPEMVPYRDEDKYGKGAYDYDFYSNVSLDAARQSITLLKNAGGALPLRAGARLSVHGSEDASHAQYETAPGAGELPSAALQAAGFNVTVVKPGARGAAPPPAAAAGTAAARAADVAVVFVGRGGCEGEAALHGCKDVDGLAGDNIPAQFRIIDAVLASGTPAVLVNFGCNPFLLNNYTEHSGVAAIVDAYYPQRFAGRAVADVLTGVYPPAGRLPFSWVRDLSDAGDLGNYTMAGTSKTYRYELANKTAPLFPFGYGLSYTSFQYSALAVSPAAVRPCQSAGVSVRVANTGRVDSDEVVQVYASWEGAALAAPARQLVGFERVHVRAGAAVTVQIAVAPAQMALLDDAAATGRYYPYGPNPPGRLRPCDGNTTNATCGFMAHTAFTAPPAGSGPYGDPDRCCASCAATPGCAGWTSSGRSCALYNDTSAVATSPYNRTLSGLTSGVVWARAARPAADACATVLPTWTVTPGTVRLSVGGQQPGQATAAPSNVLSGSFAITGAATPLSRCG